MKNPLRTSLLVEKAIPALILFFLWLDGWFFPLILLPIAYVLIVEKRSLGWLGFSRNRVWHSLANGGLIAVLLSVTYYPIFHYYLQQGMTIVPVTVYDVFTDVVWYPVYEEVAYRSFALSHFAGPNGSSVSRRTVLVNLLQSLLFLCVHRHHLSRPLLLAVVFLMGLLNGFLFLRTRNTYGCIASHSATNGFALLLRYLWNT